MNQGHNPTIIRPGSSLKICYKRSWEREASVCCWQRLFNPLTAFHELSDPHKAAWGMRKTPSMIHLTPKSHLPPCSCLCNPNFFSKQNLLWNLNSCCRVPTLQQFLFDIGCTCTSVALRNRLKIGGNSADLPTFYKGKRLNVTLETVAELLQRTLALWLGAHGGLPLREQANYGLACLRELWSFPSQMMVFRVETADVARHKDNTSTDFCFLSFPFCSTDSLPESFFVL